MKCPHPFPYQGSKRHIAARILQFFPESFRTLFEPFAGSGAVTIASAARNPGKKYCLNDLNRPLMDLWEKIVHEPDQISGQYEQLWKAQAKNPRSFYDETRNRFNMTGNPDDFLYLLARCVKSSIRYNSEGKFNQSPDNRRKGMRPETMRANILGVSSLLKDRIVFRSEDYSHVLNDVTENDLVYMDPPYQGVCSSRDRRYAAGVDFDEFVGCLENLNRRNIRYIVSYDGRTGDRVHGRKLPGHLKLTHLEIVAGRSSQETLLGRKSSTIESLYLSPTLSFQPETAEKNLFKTRQRQMNIEAYL